MKRTLNVNPIVEAIFYYTGKTNGENTEKKLAGVLNKYPEQKKAIEKAARPAAALEKLLDSKLNVNEALIVKYFKAFDNRKRNCPFAFCLASVMMYFNLMMHLDYSAEEFFEYMHKCSDAERLYSLCFGILDDCEPLYYIDNKMTEISRRVDKLNISFENKWKILNASVDYDAHIDELYSLIMPAVKLIENAQSKYTADADAFREYCTGDNLQKNFEDCFPIYETMDITPTILGFDALAYISTSKAEPEDEDSNGAKYIPTDADAPSLTNAIIGTLKQIIKDSPYSRASQLSQKLKVLSDSTRLEILFYLCSHKTYGQELSSKFNIHHSTVSYHIVRLKAAGLLIEEFSGGRVYYTADKEGIQKLIDAFAEKIK